MSVFVSELHTNKLFMNLQDNYIALICVLRNNLTFYTLQISYHCNFYLLKIHFFVAYF